MFHSHRLKLKLPAVNPVMVVSVIVFFLYLLPFIILRENAHFPINDNLDWITSWIALVNSGQVFSLEGRILEFMNGVPRSCLPSGFNIITWLFMVFQPFQAYLLNLIIVHFTAFVGMALLLNNLIKPKVFDNSWGRELIIWGTALCFGILPFYTVYGLSIAGQPLLAWAFLNAYYGRGILKNLFIIITFALYSSLPLTGIFIILALVVIAVIDFIRYKTFRKDFLFCIFFLTASYGVTEFWLIYNTFFSEGFVSNRVEIDRIALGQNIGLKKLFKVISENFINGQYHAASLHSYILSFAVPLGILAGIFHKDRLLKRLILFLTISFAISFFYGVRYLTLFMEATASSSLLSSFQIQRFHWLHPLLWYTIFALSLFLIARLKFIGKFLVAGFIIFQISFLFLNNIEYNIWFKEKEIISRESDIMPNSWLYENITYRQFYSDKLFEKVAEYINRPKKDYRVLSIGIYPAIAQYHGFFTLDGRLNIYQLNYKHEFRKIIEKELAKNSFWRKYFDKWGITCYILPAELSYLQVRKSYELKLVDLELNSGQIKKLGGKYIFSAAEIVNYKDNNLLFLTRITDDASPWEIFIYEVE